VFERSRRLLYHQGQEVKKFVHSACHLGDLTPVITTINIKTLKFTTKTIIESSLLNYALEDNH
jgi:hypothetical protein